MVQNVLKKTLGENSYIVHGREGTRQWSRIPGIASAVTAKRRGTHSYTKLISPFWFTNTIYIFIYTRILIASSMVSDSGLGHLDPRKFKTVLHEVRPGVIL